MAPPPPPPPPRQHFLVITYPGQGHINPGHSLAKRLSITTGAYVTFSTAVSAHRRMFSTVSDPDQEVSNGNGPISYIPYSDGRDDGATWPVVDLKEYIEKFDRVAPATLSSIIDDLSSRGRPVTYIIYNMQMYWVKELAVARDIPTAFYWIQAATVLAICYHYFHGYRDLITSHAGEPLFVVDLPHLPPLKIRDLPHFFADNTNEAFKIIVDSLKLTIGSLPKPDDYGAKPIVLINTFEEFETEAIEFLEEVCELLPIGPGIPALVMEGNEISNSRSADLFKVDNKGYIEWLDTKPEKSVVYVSFGSISTMSKQQLEEMQRGLKASCRPYLWVLRKNTGEGVEFEEDDDGMVVEWCDQVKVLSHPSVGCFVTHNGWNSTIESLACGVPMVAVPQWIDQTTNARLVVKCGVGVRGEVNEGVLEAEVLMSCLETIMGDGEKGVEIRKSCEMWRKKATEALREGGSSYRNFRYFLEKIAQF